MSPHIYREDYSRHLLPVDADVESDKDFGVARQVVLAEVLNDRPPIILHRTRRAVLLSAFAIGLAVLCLAAIISHDDAGPELLRPLSRLWQRRQERLRGLHPVATHRWSNDAPAAKQAKALKERFSDTPAAKQEKALKERMRMLTQMKLTASPSETRKNGPRTRVIADGRLLEAGPLLQKTMPQAADVSTRSLPAMVSRSERGGGGAEEKEPEKKRHSVPLGIDALPVVQSPVMEAEGPCVVEEDVDYGYAQVRRLEHIGSVAMCRRHCSGDPLCGAWTWGKARDNPSLTDVCELKAAKMGQPLPKRSRAGVVSGFPCQVDYNESPFSPNFTQSSAAQPHAEKHEDDIERRSKALQRAADIAFKMQREDNAKDDAKRHTTRAVDEENDDGDDDDADDYDDKDDDVGEEGGGDDDDAKEDEKKTHQKEVSRSRSRNSTAIDDEGDISSSTSISSASACQLDDSVDYSGANLYELHQVRSPKMCRKRCQGDLRCGAWTWGKARHELGLSDVCFLKARLPSGKRFHKRENKKVVSGLPCPDESATLYMPGSLFCWALMQPGNYERDLLAFQHRQHASIFACNEYTVFSNESVEIGQGLNTTVVNISLRSKYGGDYGTAMNTDIFVAVWKKVIHIGRFELHDWTVKVDPDTVFFPLRLRAILVKHPESERGVYVNNCRYGLHGPLEVFSRKAVQAWATGSWKCFRRFGKECDGKCDWGEDLFMDKCLKDVLHVKRVNDWDLLMEAHCDPPDDWASCSYRSKAAFHPFKSLKGYSKCLRNAQNVILS